MTGAGRVVIQVSMRMTALMPVLLAMAACGNADEPTRQTTVTIEKARALRFQVVDNDTGYMRRVALHVGEDDSGRAANPVARAAGVAAREDVWKIEGTNQVGRDWYLEAFDRGPVTGRVQLASYFARLGHEYAVPVGYEVAFEQTEPGRWRSYYVQDQVVLDGTAIAAAEASVDPEDRPIVMVDLTDDGARDFGELTLRITGKKLAMLSRDEVLSAPVVNGQIAGGQISISLDRAADAEALAKALAP